MTIWTRGVLGNTGRSIMTGFYWLSYLALLALFFLFAPDFISLTEALRVYTSFFAVLNFSVNEAINRSKLANLAVAWIIDGSTSFSSSFPMNLNGSRAP